MKVIAIEEHWMLPDLSAALRAQSPGDESLLFNEMGDHAEKLRDLGAGRLAEMDAQGIDVSVLALTPPATSPLDPGAARILSRAANDAAKAAVDAAPTRLRALAALPMSSPADAAAELERAVAAGFVGSMVYGRAGERTLDDPAYDDVFAASASLRVPIFIHPQIPSVATRDALYRGLGAQTDLALATFGWGWHVEAATAALRLILSGVFDRHPDLQIVLGHWGELLLFWLDRADGLSRAAGLSRPLSEFVRSNVHVTASGMLNPALLDHVRTVTTPDRLLFSTDYPFQHPTREEIAAFGKHFPADDRRAFFAGNAARLFRIPL